MARTATFRRGIYRSKRFRRLAQWFNALPHPPLAMEIAPNRISLVRWSRAGSLEDFAVEPLPLGALLPSAVESNLADLAAVQSILGKVCKRMHVREDDNVAMLLPDPVIRVFVQHFEDFPRSSEEAIPLLRWKFKKSLPFDVDEMLVSYVRQAPRENGVNVVAALARLPIVREYEEVARGAKLRPGVVLSSSIAAMALLADGRATLMVRVVGKSLTTAIVRGGILCGYRCTELPVYGGELAPRTLLDEVFPVAAYYQDQWQEGIQSVAVAGIGDRLPEFLPLFEEEFHCPAHSLLGSAIRNGRVPEHARRLAQHELEGLLGWMWHRA